MEQKVKERCRVRGVVCVVPVAGSVDDVESSAQERAGQSREDDMDLDQGLVPAVSQLSSHLLNAHSPGATWDSNLAAGMGARFHLSHFLLSWGRGSES